MKTISLTVPMDYNALTRASGMLHGLAIDLKHEGGEPVKTETYTVAPEAEVTSAPDSGFLGNVDGVDIFVDTEITLAQYAQLSAEAQEAHTGRVVANPSVFAEQPAAAQKPETPETVTTAPPVATAEAPAPALSATEPAAPAGVDLAPATTNPEVSIPWDARIHAGSRAKLAKEPHGWKMKRGVDEGLVQQVEAELMAAMSASPANPITPNEPSAPAPAQPAAHIGAVTTFPALMSAITSNKIDQATVTAAVNKAGLQSLPLLAARPDLVPTVAAELGFGG